MRTEFLLTVTLALAAVPAAGARTRMPLRCCLELEIPDVPRAPIYAQLKSRRPRLACRLLGLVGEAAPADVWAGAVDFGEAVERLLARRETPTDLPALDLLDVEERVRALAGARGAGSRAAKERLLADLFARLTPLEAKYVAKNLIREMRTGAAEGVLLDALALVAGGDRTAGPRAHMLESDPREVAA